MTEFVNNSLFGKNKCIKIAKRLVAIFLLTFKFAAYASFPWKLNRYSHGVQFGINCTALDQPKLSNFVECTINVLIAHLNNYSVSTHSCFSVLCCRVPGSEHLA